MYVGLAIPGVFLLRDIGVGVHGCHIGICDLSLIRLVREAFLKVRMCIARGLEVTGLPELRLGLTLRKVEVVHVHIHIHARCCDSWLSLLFALATMCVQCGQSVVREYES